MFSLWEKSAALATNYQSKRGRNAIRSADWPFWINLINSGTCHSPVTHQAKMSQKIGTFALAAERILMSLCNVQKALAHHHEWLGHLSFIVFISDLVVPARWPG